MDWHQWLLELRAQKLTQVELLTSKKMAVHLNHKDVSERVIEEESRYIVEIEEILSKAGVSF